MTRSDSENHLENEADSIKPLHPDINYQLGENKK
jgi:hypothetical protein